MRVIDGEGGGKGVKWPLNRGEGQRERNWSTAKKKLVRRARKCLVNHLKLLRLISCSLHSPGFPEPSKLPHFILMWSLFHSPDSLEPSELPHFIVGLS